MAFQVFFNTVGHPYEYFETFFFLNGIYYFYWSEDIGFYASIDSCQTWQPVEPKTNHYVHQADGYLFAGGYRGGVIRTNTVEIDGEIFSNVFESIDSAETALRVFPNPTNGDFHVSTKGLMFGAGQLCIFDAKGQLVSKTEVNDMGSSIPASCAGLADGIYFLKLFDEEKTMTGTVVYRN